MINDLTLRVFGWGGELAATGAAELGFLLHNIVTTLRTLHLHISVSFTNKQRQVTHEHALTYNYMYL